MELHMNAEQLQNATDVFAMAQETLTHAEAALATAENNNDQAAINGTIFL